MIPETMFSVIKETEITIIGESRDMLACQSATVIKDMGIKQHEICLLGKVKDNRELPHTDRIHYAATVISSSTAVLMSTYFSIHECRFLITEQIYITCGSVWALSACYRQKIETSSGFFSCEVSARFGFVSVVCSISERH